RRFAPALRPSLPRAWATPVCTRSEPVKRRAVVTGGRASLLLPRPVDHSDFFLAASSLPAADNDGKAVGPSAMRADHVAAWSPPSGFLPAAILSANVTRRLA